MSLIDNEQTKLLANALDRASTACFTVGILSSLAGYVYGVVDLGRRSFSVGRFSLYLLGWQSQLHYIYGRDAFRNA